MNKQEKIREGVEELIKHWIRKNYLIGKGTFPDLVKRIQAFEDSQGVVIKVDGELPLKPESYDNYYAEWQRYDEGQEDLLKAGCGFFEPLIKKGKR